MREYSMPMKGRCPKMKYIAVFKSLSYANRIQNCFDYDKAPEIIKTPKKVAGGCSYSITFGDSKLEHVKKYLSKNQKGFIGLYKETKSGSFDKIEVPL